MSFHNGIFNSVKENETEGERDESFVAVRYHKRIISKNKNIGLLEATKLAMFLAQIQNTGFDDPEAFLIF